MSRSKSVFSGELSIDSLMVIMKNEGFEFLQIEKHIRTVIVEFLKVIAKKTKCEAQIELI